MGTNHCLQEPFNRVSAGNTLQVYYASENSAQDQDILMRSSTDDGATWSDTYTVAGGTTTGRDSMPGCTSFSRTPSKVLSFLRQQKVTGRYSPSKVFCPMMTEPHGVKEARCIFLQEAEIMVCVVSLICLPLHCFDVESRLTAGSPQVTTTSGGAFVASFMTDEDTSLHKW